MRESYLHGRLLPNWKSPSLNRNTLESATGRWCCRVLILCIFRQSNDAQQQAFSEARPLEYRPRGPESSGRASEARSALTANPHRSAGLAVDSGPAGRYSNSPLCSGVVSPRLPLGKGPPFIADGFREVDRAASVRGHGFIFVGRGAGRLRESRRARSMQGRSGGLSVMARTLNVVARRRRTHRAKRTRELIRRCQPRRVRLGFLSWIS